MVFSPQTSFSLEGTDIRIPSCDLGTFQPDPSLNPDTSVKDSVLQALKTGYRHIDAALAYGWGSVERDIGDAIRESEIPREELFVVTKLHNCFHAPEDVSVGMEMSLKNLGLGYVKSDPSIVCSTVIDEVYFLVDLYLMHCKFCQLILLLCLNKIFETVPYAYVRTETYGTQRRPDGKASDPLAPPLIDIPLSKAFDETWAAMEKLVLNGKTRLIGMWKSICCIPHLMRMRIGVSNFSSPKLARLLKTAKFHPVANQDFCKENKIHLIVHSPLGGVPIPVLVGRKSPGRLEDPLVKELAKKYGKTPARIILCYTICRGISVLPKSNNISRISENYQVFLIWTMKIFER
ncbi:hypothetical protein HYALB_00003175 [Hymenoscyphus albidus]|uniref:NADP-dependent oxidoreductase domain-containing protein n=1 Tax=Hymenoscyphus albidus TaxID=595503 RepID=A0A9N9LFL2_9HELO|nr:hypothetical protein HYALB_00003175 [Hymenoscyphus albidus]